MKNSNYLALLAGLVLVGGGIAGCDNKEDDLNKVNPQGPSVELTVNSSDASGATVTVKTAHITEVAWTVAAEEPENLSAAILFKDGTVQSCEDGENTVSVSGLEPLTHYIFYLAAKTDTDEYYSDGESEIVTAEFTTADFTEDVTIVDRTYDGFSVHVKVPESVKEAGNVLRYSYGSLVMYNSNKSGWMAQADAQMLEANGQVYIEDSQTIVYNEENSYYTDDEGNVIVLYDPLVPGEPGVFFVGEFAWGESIYGWGEGYYSALFDFDGWYNDMENEDAYWTGHFKKINVRAREPEVLDATVDVDCSDVQAVTGTVRFTPDPEVYQYCVCVMDHAAYLSMLELLDNNEEYLQWFTTSYYASSMLGMQTFQGNVEMDLTQYYYLEEQSHYHVLVTAMGDAEGTAQSFSHIEFDTTEKSMAAPEVTVTAIPNPSGEEDPFEVWFNIKNTGSVEVASAMYAANYEREWAGALQQGMTYADITASGNGFTSAEVAQINTAEGYDVAFSTLDDMTTVLAVLAYNIEETPNDLNAEDCPAIASATSIPQPDAERVDSELFSALEGEWTMTADVYKNEYSYETYTWETVHMEDQTTKVTIYDGIEDYPETLPEDVYDIYIAAGLSREEATAYYEEFKMEAEAFNAKVRGQNRLLCLGFGYDDPDSYYGPVYTPTTPYELFCNAEYSSYDVASLFYDFGPKWYLQVDADGNVSVPVNSERMYPLQAWTDNNIYYLAGVGEDGYVSVGEGGENLYFPANVASDNNTVTVSPMTLTTTSGEGLFYPNGIYLSYGSAVVGGYTVDSEVTLTRGWTGVSAQAAASSSKAESLKLQPANGMYTVSPVPQHKSRTSFLTAKSYKKAEGLRIVTGEEFEQNLRTFVQERNSRR